MLLANLPLRTKLSAAFGAIIVLMGITALAAHAALQRATEHNEQAMATMDQAMLVVQREVDHLNWTNQLAGSFLARARFAGQLDYTQCAFGQWFYTFRDSQHYASASESFRTAFDAMEGPHTQLHQSAVDIVELQRQGNHGAAEGIYHQRTVTILDNLRGRLHAFQELLETERLALLEQARTQSAWAMRTIIGSLMVAAVAAIFLAVVTSRHIVRRLGDTVNSLDEIAEGDGDLTRRLDADGRDEISQLAAAYNRFVEKVHQMVKQVADSAGQIATATEQLATTAEEDRQGVAHQRDQTSHVATAMNQMRASIQEIARAAQEVADTARGTSREAQEGKRRIGHATGAMDALAENVRRSSETIRQLDEQSTNIGRVLEVIRGIADQTNLLALNAAIEAARAGDTGRGFAVVAEEVRTLAQRTQDSIGEIHEMVEGIQGGTQRAVEAMDDNQEYAEKTVEEAAGARSTLDEITAMVDRIDEMTTQVASAVEEQSQTANEINYNVNNINDIAEQTGRSVEETATVSDQLARLAGELQVLVGRFRV